MSPPDITVLTDLCPHNKINKHTLSLSLFCSSSLLSSLPPSLSLILALLPRLPYSLLLHIPRRSCRLWISLSLLQDTNKRKPIRLSYLCLSFSHGHTNTHLQFLVFLGSHASSYSLCLSLSVCLLLTCKHTPPSPRQRSSKGIGVVLGVWLLVVWLTGSRAADGDVKTGSAR